MLRGSADNLLKNHNLDDTVGLQRVRDALEMCYLHSLRSPVIHGNVKAANRLVDDYGNAVLCNYGLSIALDDYTTGFTTTEHQSPASDIWAWACLVLEILKRKKPYEYLRDREDRPSNIGYLIKVICVDKMLPGRAGDLMGLEEQVVTLVHHCWLDDPTGRPSASDCCRVLDLWCQEHSCEHYCELPGNCELNAVSNAVKAAFIGCHESFQFTRMSQLCLQRLSSI
ncbi:hypothetical protein FRB95_001251 [Tulasnella sp. JGI-2019a]|nr:hypothetical protein FRB95_001251 [Tulasnella sp. JGI-2019a]